MGSWPVKWYSKATFEKHSMLIQKKATCFQQVSSLSGGDLPFLTASLSTCVQSLIFFSQIINCDRLNQRALAAITQRVSSKDDVTCRLPAPLVYNQSVHFQSLPAHTRYFSQDWESSRKNPFRDTKGCYHTQHLLLNHGCEPRMTSGFRQHRSDSHLQSILTLPGVFHTSQRTAIFQTPLNPIFGIFGNKDSPPHPLCPSPAATVPLGPSGDLSPRPAAFLLLLLLLRG